MAIADASALEGQVQRATGSAFLKSGFSKATDWAVCVWIFAGSVVVTEPSPYELVFVVVLGLSLFAASFTFQRSTLGLLVLWATFIPFAIIAAFQTRFTALSDALIFQLVTIFLFFTSYWIANYVAERPQERMRRIIKWYVIAAAISAAMGTAGYLGLVPGGHDLLTRYDRAKALFNDPNVFGPFLILPAMYALQRVLLDKPKRAIWGAIVVMVITLGIFTSFSRAAWGHYIASGLGVYLLVFFGVANAREKVRMLVIAIVGVMAVLVALGGLLSIPKVQELFELRAQAQSYDEGDGGRFGRQGYAFELALANPWGIGPLEFRNLKIKEEPHDAYVDALHVYGWGGGLMIWLFIGTTIWRGLSFVFRPSPNKLLLIPLIAVWIPLCVEAVLIDLDHWRHFWLVGGLIWGVTAAYGKILPGEEKRLSALV